MLLGASCLSHRIQRVCRELTECSAATSSASSAREKKLQLVQSFFIIIIHSKVTKQKPWKTALQARVLECVKTEDGLFLPDFEQNLRNLSGQQLQKRKGDKNDTSNSWNNLQRPFLAIPTYVQNLCLHLSFWENQLDFFLFIALLGLFCNLTHNLTTQQAW